MSSKASLISSLVISLMTTSFCAATDEINHLQLNKAHLIETGEAHYAIRAPILEQNDWKTFSINANNVLIVSEQCKQTIRTKQSLSQRELDLLMEARRQLFEMNENKEPATRYCWALWSLTSETFALKYAKRINLSMFNHNGSSVTLYDKDNFSVSRLDLPKELVRVFVADGVATFVYGRHGRVDMKPIKCLDEWEAHLIEELKRDAHPAGHMLECPTNENNTPNQRAQETNQLELKLREHQLHQLEQQKQLQQLYQQQEQQLLQQQQKQQFELYTQLDRQMKQQEQIRQEQKQQEDQYGKQQLQQLALKQQQQQIQLQRQQLKQFLELQQSSLNWPKNSK